MATAVNDSYSAASGASVYGGMAGPLRASRVVVAGDSLTSLTYPAAGYRWGMPILRTPPLMVYNAGVANDTISLLIARWQADVLDQTPTLVMLRIGTNSLGDSTAVFRANYQTLLDSLRTNNIFGIIHAIPPRTGGVAAILVGHNTWLAAQCAASPSRLLFCNDSVDLGDVNYDYDSSYFLDGIHMNAKGVRAQGVRMAPVLAPIFTVDPRITDGANQWVTNSLNTGTAGTKFGVTGTVPTSWDVQASGSGAAGVCSIVAADVGDAVQVPWLRLALTGAGASGNLFTFSATMTHPAIAADLTVKRLDCVVEVRFNNLDTTALDFLFLCPQNAGANVGDPLKVPLTGIGTLNELGVLRNSWPRDQSGASPSSYLANALKLVLYIQSAAAFGSIGSIDLRCASVQGLSA